MKQGKEANKPIHHAIIIIIIRRSRGPKNTKIKKIKNKNTTTDANNNGGHHPLSCSVSRGRHGALRRRRPGAQPARRHFSLRHHPRKVQPLQAQRNVLGGRRARGGGRRRADTWPARLLQHAHAHQAVHARGPRTADGRKRKNTQKKLFRYFFFF